MVVSLVLAAGGVTLLPAYMERLLPASVVARRQPQTITLSPGYHRRNPPAALARFLAKSDTLRQFQP